LSPAPLPGASLSVIDLIEQTARALEQAGLSLADGFGHGTLNAFDEAAWLVLWSLQLPLDDLDSVRKKPVASEERARVATLLGAPGCKVCRFMSTSAASFHAR
jgi:ribosomal protein L3 glutamine methyltransferase